MIREVNAYYGGVYNDISYESIPGWIFQVQVADEAGQLARFQNCTARHQRDSVFRRQ